MTDVRTQAVDFYTTCPPFRPSEPAEYIRRVSQVSRWSDEAGCKGILVYTDNGLLDPWIVAQIVLQNSEQLMPLVAVQPIYMHPYTVAKMVATLSYLFHRRICLNMVAGGFKNDLIALHDLTPHDQRYERLVEYTTIIQRLLAGGSPVTFHGKFYSVERLALTPAVPQEFFPRFMLSGSSEAGLAAARALDALPMQYPEPPDKCGASAGGGGAGAGIRVGIIAREDEEQAWHIAEERFPPDRAGQVTHALAMKTSDSAWHQNLATVGHELNGRRSTYWLVPFENYKTFCPYLVGSHAQVAEEVRRYLAAGYQTFLVDVPETEEDLEHIGITFEHALRGLPAANVAGASL